MERRHERKKCSRQGLTSAKALALKLHMGCNIGTKISNLWPPRAKSSV